MTQPFIDIEWVERRREEIVLVDSRWYLDGRSGREAYERGHLPGAVFVDLETALTGGADAATGGRHPLPEPEDFAGAMGALGIGDEDTVVAYDDAGGVMAARLVWMLRVTGHEAALLDGGIRAWRGELATGPAARRLDAGESDREPTAFSARPWPAERLATIDEAADAARSGTAAVLDARSRERFLGEPDDLDPRAGHIPGARSVPCRENVAADGRLLPAGALRANFDLEPGEEVIAYCGSGVTACHSLLALEQAGLGAGRLFPGSWSQWSRDPARPVQTGAGSPG